MLKSKRKEILGVVVCDNEVERRREFRIPANTKVNTSWAVRCWEEWAVERYVKVKKNSSKEKYYEVNPDIKKDVYDLLQLLIINGRDLFAYCAGQQGNIQINARRFI